MMPIIGTNDDETPAPSASEAQAQPQTRSARAEKSEPLLSAREMYGELDETP